MSIDKDIARANKYDDNRRIHREVKNGVAKPAHYKTQGKKAKRAIFWNGKIPADKSPKGFVRRLTDARLDKMNIERMFFGKHETNE